MFQPVVVTPTWLARKVRPKMKNPIRSLFLALALFGAAAQTAPAIADTPPPGFPANLRYDLVPKWIQWVAEKPQITWPPNDGCAAPPRAQSLTPGQMIDRFGSDTGTFFSPRGASFRSRAVPYVCSQMDYRVYRVVKPIAVKSCKAAPWFNEPGGAVQVKTAEPASKLVASGMIEQVSYAAGGSSGAAPQCGRP
jgi:hypothetical protein